VVRLEDLWWLATIPRHSTTKQRSLLPIAQRVGRNKKRSGECGEKKTF